MQITRQTEYAIRTLLELAKAQPDDFLSTRFISEQQDIPEDFLKKTVKLLVLAELVSTQRGTGGGVRLARPAEDISMLDIITAIEGPIAINICLSPSYKCPNQPTCPSSRVLKRAQDALVQELRRESLADMLKQAN